VWPPPPPGGTHSSLSSKTTKVDVIRIYKERIHLLSSPFSYAFRIAEREREIPWEALSKKEASSSGEWFPHLFSCYLYLKPKKERVALLQQLARIDH
jgi:hypothetical protein